MEFSEFLKKYQNLPLLNTDLLLIGETDPRLLRVQLSRWVKAGHLFRLKRGAYAFAPHFQKILPSPYLIASALIRPSYVSLEKALEFHGLIPEAVFTVTCVTTKRPGRFETPLGRFSYNHVQPQLFWGYTSVLFKDQAGSMAHPEKALLDLVYLRAPRLTKDYLDGLRLQNLEKIDVRRFLEYGRRFKKPRMLHAAGMIVAYMKEIASTEKKL